jgi:hypothetical protein
MTIADGEKFYQTMPSPDRCLLRRHALILWTRITTRMPRSEGIIARIAVVARTLPSLQHHLLYRKFQLVISTVHHLKQSSIITSYFKLWTPTWKVDRLPIPLLLCDMVTQLELGMSRESQILVDSFMRDGTTYRVRSMRISTDGIRRRRKPWPSCSPARNCSMAIFPLGPRRA